MLEATTGSISEGGGQTEVAGLVAATSPASPNLGPASSGTVVSEPLCASTVVSESLSELEDLSFGQIGAFEVIQKEDSD